MPVWCGVETGISFCLLEQKWPQTSEHKDAMLQCTSSNLEVCVFLSLCCGASAKSSSVSLTVTIVLIHSFWQERAAMCTVPESTRHKNGWKKMQCLSKLSGFSNEHGISRIPVPCANGKEERYMLQCASDCLCRLCPHCSLVRTPKLAFLGPGMHCFAYFPPSESTFYLYFVPGKDFFV